MLGMYGYGQLVTKYPICALNKLVLNLHGSKFLVYHPFYLIGLTDLPVHFRTITIKLEIV